MVSCVSGKKNKSGGGRKEGIRVSRSGQCENPVLPSSPRGMVVDEPPGSTGGDEIDDSQPKAGTDGACSVVKDTPVELFNLAEIIVDGEFL